LEERRKNYEAGEERKRREILAQRKKEIQEATEKFQRSNFTRNRKKIKHSERTPTPTKTGKSSTCRLYFVSIQCGKNLSVQFA
jgi:hypothetical protein